MQYNEQSIKDDARLASSLNKAYKKLRVIAASLPSNWSLELSKDNAIYYSDIYNAYKKIKDVDISDYYCKDGKTCIRTDCQIIYLSIKDGDSKIKIPIFIGENKHQGTNEKRILEGKEKQAIGNAVERLYKNYNIIYEYCKAFDDDYFPYTIYCNGCDFGKEMTSTTKSKIKVTPNLNVFYPNFDNRFPGNHGGTVYYQDIMFSESKYFDTILECCVYGINHYLKKFKIKDIKINYSGI